MWKIRVFKNFRFDRLILIKNIHFELEARKSSGVVFRTLGHASVYLTRGPVLFALIDTRNERHCWEYIQYDLNPARSPRSNTLLSAKKVYARRNDRYRTGEKKAQEKDQLQQICHYPTVFMWRNGLLPLQSGNRFYNQCITQILIFLKYGKLTSYLSVGSRNYKPKKPEILSRNQIEEFLK